MAKGEDVGKSCCPGNKCERGRVLRYGGTSQFSAYATTVRGLRSFDAAFDLLNSRNPCGTGFKAPMRLTYREWWMNVIDSTVKYVINGIEGEQWNPDDRGQTEDWFRRLHHLPTQRKGDLREACGMHRPSYALPVDIQAEPGSFGAVLLISSESRRVHNNPTASQYKSSWDLARFSSRSSFRSNNSTTHHQRL